MHLVFERSKGHFGSSCNILALAWTPYYQERQFRQALFDYHQRQLLQINGAVGQSVNLGISQNHQVRARSEIRRDQHEASSSEGLPNGVPNGEPNNASENNHQPAAIVKSSRLCELRQRCQYLKSATRCKAGVQSEGAASWTQMDYHYDLGYGKKRDFGWLVIGNVGKLIGITLTSLVPPPLERSAKASERNCRKNSGDLIQFDDEASPRSDMFSEANQPSTVLNASGSSATNHRDDDVSFRPDRRGARQNYNLRGHMEEIILVRWNELYQKLATVDSKGNVLIWCKLNDKFQIQTPFYNRTKSVADFKWSHDGKTALICYTDSFILVGSSSGQRSWHSMLNLNDYHMTCASWTPDDQQLLLGVSNGNMVVIDLPNNELTELVVDQTNIRAICWSSSEISLKNLDSDSTKQSFATPRDSEARRNSYGKNNTVVNQRRLSRDCSVFSRYRLCSQGLNQQQQQQQQQQFAAPNNSREDQTSVQESAQKSSASASSDILAIDFANNTIKLYKDGLSDSKPTTIHVNQESYLMQWSSDGQILAVAGFNIHTSAPTVGCLRCRYVNAIKFYNQQGRLLYEYVMRYARYPITAFTWAHDDRRLFVATGQRLHCAKVFQGVPKLSLLAISNFQRFTKLPDKSDILESVIGHHFSPSLPEWQSHNCPVSLAATRADGEPVRNNCLVHQYRLPSKLLTKIDQMFSTTIWQPYDDNWSLSDVVWRVPRGQQRHYCTLICYASEREVSINDHQYRASAVNAEPPPKGGGDDYAHVDQNKIFVLYAEIQGSLIPILRARRIGYLKPEFVIFDPDDGHRTQQRQRKVSDISQAEHSSGKAGPMQSQYHDNTGTLMGAGGGSIFDGDQSMSLNRQQIERRQAELANGGRSHHQEPPPMLSNNPHLMMLMMGCSPSADYFSHYHNQQPSSYPSTSNATDYGGFYHSSGASAAHAQTPKRSAIRTPRKAHRRSRESGLSSSLPETSEMIRIRSNIWGTKFKLINVANRMIRHRSVIGSVTYKASILHLQPRQIHLGLKDMSNYCCLCSKHHHRALPTSRNNINPSSSRVSQKLASDLTLLDLPNTPSSAPSPRQKSSRRSKRSGTGAGDGDSPVVVLDVGASLRIMPTPPDGRPVQRGNFHTMSRHNSDVATSFGPRHRRSHRRQHDDLQSSDHLKSLTRAPNVAPAPSRIDEPSTSFAGQRDDILTLSLGQGDQVKVEMSSMRTMEGEPIDKADHQQQADFLAMNKTLKSIQTITRMIVDLSSRADNVDADCGAATSDQADWASPCKAAKRCEQDSPTSAAGVRRISPVLASASSSSWIPPQAPVHRPRRTAAASKGPHLYGELSAGTQSASCTPLKSRARPSNRPSRNRERRPLAGCDDAPLPPPPLPVPIGRRISSSAKRFLDGSLRSLSLSGSTGYSMSLAGGSMDDVEPEESEPLVNKPPSRWLMKAGQPATRALGSYAQSQPCSPMRSSSQAASSARSFRHQADAFLSSASSFRSQLMQRLKNPASGDRQELPSGMRPQQSNSQLQELDDSDSDLDFSQSEGSAEDEVETGASSQNARAMFASVRDLSRLRAAERRRRPTKVEASAEGHSSTLTRQRSRRKSICPNANCCCAKEFKLSNRPPVWNESSQVYQLDFGGRVTQESAKNLQIDYDGNLALQFGRINRRTYTLDYRYPFNAVQAMAVALASLTQRLK